MRSTACHTLIAAAILAAATQAQMTMSHSLDDMTITPANSVACQATMATPPYTVDNSYWRSYTLSGFGVTSDIVVQEIRFAVENSLAGDLAMPPFENPVEFRLYTDPTPPNPAPMAGLNLLHTENYQVPDAAGAIMNAPITAGGTAVSCTVTNSQPAPIVGPVTLAVDAMAVVTPPVVLMATDTLVVELFTPDYSTMVTPTTGTPAFFFVGSNGGGQTDVTYLSSAGCAILEPTDVAAIGFPMMMMILDVVYDTYSPPAPPDLIVTVEWSLAGAGTFNPCTMTVASPNPNPTTGGTPGMFGYEWDAAADGAGTMMIEMVDVRVTVLDTVSMEQNTCLTTLEVDNTVPASLCTTLCGDCNLGGSGPDILDALTGAQIGAGLTMPSAGQTGCCDVDNSGTITVIDALLMAQAAAGLAVTLICP